MSLITTLRVSRQGVVFSSSSALRFCTNYTDSLDRGQVPALLWWMDVPAGRCTASVSRRLAGLAGRTSRPSLAMGGSFYYGSSFWILVICSVECIL